MRIYTRTGDAGETGLIGGARVCKDHDRIECVGAIDEVNACIGVCRALAPDSSLDPALERLQHELFDLGAEIADPKEKLCNQGALDQRHISALERSIDAMTRELEPLRNFVLPGGAALAAQLHLARTVCRRAERRLLRLHHDEPLRADVITYVNRLSDWLFVAARYANAQEGVPDVEWHVATIAEPDLDAIEEQSPC